MFEHLSANMRVLFATSAVFAATNSCGDGATNGPGNSLATGGVSGTAVAAGGSGEGGSAAGGASGEAGGAGGSTPGESAIAVDGSANLMSYAACDANPADLPDLPAGTYTIALEASTLTKGTVDTQPEKLPSQDNYVIVHVPTIADADQEHRFFMLNGIGAQREVTLAQPGSLDFVFIDSDISGNHGFATIVVNPGGYRVFVDAEVHVLIWRDLCNATPARLDVGAGHHVVDLATSDLSAANGRNDDYVVLRLPSEVPQDDYRYIILNGVGATFEFEAADGGPLRAWFISSSQGGTGQATVKLSSP